MEIGKIVLSEGDASRYYQDGKYIVTYSSVYQICYSAAQGSYYGMLVHAKPTRGGTGFVGRGKWAAMDAAECNVAIGLNLFDID